MVRREPGRVRLTLGGRLALAEFEEFQAGVEGLMDAWSVLDPVPADSKMDLSLFRGADVISPDRYAPHQPVEAMEEFLRGANRIQGVASAVLPEYVDIYSEQIIDQGMDVELVVPNPVLETLVTEYREELVTSLETGRLELMEVETNPPFSAIIAQHEFPELGVVIYSESGTAGVIRNSSEEALDWAREWIDHWQERGDPIRPAGINS